MPAAPAATGMSISKGGRWACLTNEFCWNIWVTHCKEGLGDHWEHLGVMLGALHR